MSLLPQPHDLVAVISSDAQALETAEQIAEQLRRDSIERDRERRLPHPELALFSRSGLWGISVPKAFGGAGVSNVTLAKVIARIAQADASLGQIPQNHFYALEVLRVNGSPQQQARLYAEVLAGRRFGNALAELGTKTAHDRTTALTRDGDGYRINGRKFYATGALYAQRIPTSVIDEQGVQQLAFVPADSAGLDVIDDWSGFGQRTTGSGSVVFDNVRVEADDVVPFQSAFERPTPVGPLAQILHAAIDTGIARAAYEDALHFVRTRTRPWIDSGIDKAVDDPLTLKSFGHLAIRLHATEALLERAGEYLDRAQAETNADTVAAASIAVAEARAISTEISLAAGSTLFELAGSQATLAEHGLDRHWRNARVHTLHDPVRWKYHAIGNFYLNDENPPLRGTI
ncbi:MULTISPECIES: SfnB family sulfur acquisition oxidoreductase [Pseudomonas]|jgi:SfnB family sulfur acquisition oxidoreductase|uniref:SfnB family sulfur acquisition oxidoreductase n=2 Tax=Pseudomonas TaxID=286 RepID=A0A9X8EEZ3_PSEPU|nr:MULTISPECIES: SfnB family sulfur acquisition oxidoreductase [Pseudomonas]KTC20020.1 SfnB family sulfur acquisition oxidoreductase [Pseudomonas putida]MBG8561390.1 SfnB family sulfur acquisition oxidoreductase [Pseudomonas qingdaonensis]OOV95795.1 SfnB family sulfur acquisition oxidoreductase [Pseudomonas sp. MF6396]OUM33599.1 SfnB family sulfur acquisition oxidoreductase [Pseudomonas sp. 1239]QVL19177.1 SfnB family sulfur acquisition oxidoreductase [Pseudomonas qingdaonensis]